MLVVLAVMRKEGDKNDVYAIASRELLKERLKERGIRYYSFRMPSL